MSSRTSLVLALATIATSLVLGCGGSSSPSVKPTVTLTASASTVDAADTVSLTASVANDSHNAGVIWSVSGGGLLSNSTTASTTYTAPAAASAAQTVTVTATSVANTAAAQSVTLTVPAQVAIATTSAQLTGTEGAAYSVQLTATGGIAPYNWSLPSNATLPPGWTLSTSGLLTAPAPSAAQVGTYNLAFQVTDSGTATAETASAALDLTVQPVTNGAKNSYLTGTYVCSLAGFFDQDSARWSALASFQVDGAGNITSGVIDMNSRDFAAALTGTLSGAYSVGADNNGLATTKATWSTGATSTYSWAIALNKLAGPAASVFRMVESDDTGATPSGQRGEAVCEQATTSAFTAATLGGRSFIFDMVGETAAGIPQRHLGLLNAAANGSLTGVVDGATLNVAAPASTTQTGTYTTPDPVTGRFTEMNTSTNAANGVQTTQQFVVYIYDANHMFRLETADSGGNTQIGALNAQTAASYTAATIFKGPFVTNGQGFQITNGTKSGDISFLNHGTADGAGNLTIDQSYQDVSGTYTSGEENGVTTPIAFDPVNPGRATFTPPGGGFGFLYFDSKNTGFELIFNPTNGVLESGNIANQIQTTFTDVALAGNYLHAPQAILEPTADITTGEFAIDNAGNVTGSLSITNQNEFEWEVPFSSTYQWDTSVPNTGAFLIGTGNNQASCVVVMATRALCIQNTSPQAEGFNLQQ